MRIKEFNITVEDDTDNTFYLATVPTGWARVMLHKSRVMFSDPGTATSFRATLEEGTNFNNLPLAPVTSAGVIFITPGSWSFLAETGITTAVPYGTANHGYVVLRTGGGIPPVGSTIKGTIFYLK
jgi:hypothetical protein